jgi:hypothetical protein
LDVTNNGSSSVDVTIEDEGAATTDTVTVASGATVTSVESFGDIDVIELSNDVDGTVVVTDGSGTTFATIYGSDEYTGDGSLGVPALGSGSHASAIGSDYVIFNDDTYDFDGTEIADEIISGELNVSLEIEDNEKTGDTRRNIHSSGRRVTWTATIAGESESVDQTYEYLTGKSTTVKWTADEGSVTGNNAEWFSPGSSSFEAGSGKATRDIEIQSKGVTIS